MRINILSIPKSCSYCKSKPSSAYQILSTYRDEFGFLCEKHGYLLANTGSPREKKEQIKVYSNTFVVFLLGCSAAAFLILSYLILRGVKLW